MKDIIKHALTRRAAIADGRGNTQELEIPPNTKLVYPIYFFIAALTANNAIPKQKIRHNPNSNT